MIVAGLDTETTSKLDPAHRIIETFIQKWDVDPVTFDARFLESKLWRTHPDRSIEPAAFKVHGISLDDLAGQPKMEVHAPEIDRYMRGVDLFVAHNGNEFDRPYIRMEFERCGVDLANIDGSKWFDTMLAGRWANTWGKVPSLRELCYACDVEYDPAKAHAADYDVTVLMRCFFTGLKLGFFIL